MDTQHPDQTQLPARQHKAQEEPPDAALRVAKRVFIGIEHYVYVGIGLLLALAAVVALVGAVGLLWNSTHDLTGEESVLRVIDRLLFVLMLVEIFHTVRVSIQSGALTSEPFLIVGLIATIRRVLVITLQTSEVTKGNDWTPQQEAILRASMIELGVLAGLIIVMVVSIWILRRAAATHPSSESVSTPSS